MRADRGVVPTLHPDAQFAKYAASGAYHWKETGRGLLTHNAFTAERYRRVIALADLSPAHRVLDYGCGDGALIGRLHRYATDKNLTLHGFDANARAIDLAEEMLGSRGIPATLHRNRETLPDKYFDRVVCTEVIEHVTSPRDLLADIQRVLAPGGRLVVSTPVRLTETPEDANHVREWFPSEFAQLFAGWRVIVHQQIIPAAAVEVYFWRPWIFLRVPVFRLLCNLLSFHANVNAMSWLRMRPRLFMMQIVVAESLG